MGLKTSSSLLQVLFLLCLGSRGTYGVTDSPSTAVYSPKPPEECGYDFTGPSEDIFIIDRSQSFSKSSFDASKEFVEYLIKNSFILKEGQNHIAVFTFTSNATKDIDMVSDGTAVPPECELFLPGGLWENVAYDSTNMHGENMYDAVLMALGVFESSPRKSVTSVSRRLWFMTDFHDITADLNLHLFSGVDFYGYSAGEHADDSKFIRVIGTEKAGCNYRNKSDWEKARESFRKGNKTSFQPVAVTNRELCGDQCPSGCTCQITSPGVTSCVIGVSESTTVAVESYQGMDLTIIIAASASAICVVIIIAIVIVVCFCWYRMKQKESKTKPVPSLTQPMGTNTDTMSTVVTDASTGTYNGAVNTISQSVQNEPPYVNGEVAQILMEHGVAQNTMAKNQKSKDSQVSKPALTMPGKLYHKNPGMKTPDTYCGRSNFHLGHNRNVSDVSNVSSTPSYIVPIPDDQSIAGSVPGYNKYSYPYLELDENGRPYMNVNSRPYEAPGTHGPRSPPSTHSYEKFAFPYRDDIEEDNNNLASTNGMTPELANKLSKFRQKCDKAETIKYTEFNDEQSSRPPVGEVVTNMRFPDRILPVNPREKQQEENPMYVDPEERQIKRSSAKLGTLKFKNLFYMFSKENGQNETDSKETGQSPGDYSVPYSTHPGMPNKEISHPFREIM